jgi:hypothetical protein
LPGIGYTALSLSPIAAVLGVTAEFLLNETKTSPDEAVIDEAFYRKYKQMPKESKRRLRQILNAWAEDV